MESGLTETAHFKVSGLKSSSDRSRIETDLGSIDGVRTVNIDSDSDAVEVVYDSTIVNATRLREAVESGGFTFSDTDRAGTEPGGMTGLGVGNDIDRTRGTATNETDEAVTR